MASRGKTTQLKNMYVADFETCDSLPNGDEHTPQKVWLSGFKNLETYVSTYFYNLHDFMEAILSRGDNSNREYAFHNLKFDGSYIVPWLFENGYTFTHERPTSKQFTALVDNRNNWYSIVIQPTAKRKITLWDLTKLFPTSLEYLPEQYHTPTKKLVETIDYVAYRPDPYEPTQTELDYFENDLQVPAETLNAHIDLYGLRFKKTQASQSFYNFQQDFKFWKYRFNPLTDEQDKIARKAYWGGISYVPSDKAGKDYYNVGVFDINSSYPDKIANCRLPYGNMNEYRPKGLKPNVTKFWVAEAVLSFDLKPNHLPCIPKKAISEGRRNHWGKWLESSEGYVVATFSSIDYQNMLLSYNVEIKEWLGSYHWSQKKHKELSQFIHKNNDTKVKHRALAKQSTGEERVEHLTIANRAKIDNNSFYGKFGEEIIKENKTPYPREDLPVAWVTDHTEVQSEPKRKFLPLAIAITALGRQQLIKGANILGKYFLYCDTDSLHYLKDGGDELLDKATTEGEFERDSTKLGAWDYEGTYTRGRYLRAKCYMEETPEGELEATVAGLPADPHSGAFSKKRSCLNWDNFEIGTVIPAEKSNKLRSVPTSTGTKLVPTDFTIREHDLIFDF